MDIKTVKELMKEFNECQLTKLELKFDDSYINMEKKKEVIRTPETIISSESVEENQPIQPSSPDIIGCQIVSPMVGTVYTGPEPGADPFVHIGKKVKKGDVVCIIEAMKLMNEVEAEISGEIVDVLIENEEMVEFGQPLFIIKA